MKKIYIDDCLNVLKSFKTNKNIDLIYLDPPFGGKCDKIFGLSWDCLNDYLNWIRPILYELHRVLKNTGSIYLHCDPTASHYLKIIMDNIFGVENFQNEIVWCYRSGGATKKRFSRKHDVLLFYAKDVNKCRYNCIKERVYYEKPFFNPEQDEQGRYYADVLPVDWWTDVQPVLNLSKERTEYPTQKPLALLERIIKASSNRGDVVLDPFCGSGTTIVSAQKLGRQWIGIDINHECRKIIIRRLEELKCTLKKER